MSLLSQKHLQNEPAAYKWVEKHVWPDGPVCCHCGETERVSRMRGKATRMGLYKCYACRKQFNVKIGTIFEKSHVKLHLWLQAFYLIAGSKKGISANQLHRTLGVTLKTAWFMGHRIREAMRQGTLSPMGGGGKIVEVDETYVGKKKSAKRFSKPHRKDQKMTVLTLVDREGDARSFHISETTGREIVPIVQANVDRESKIATDEGRHYGKFKDHFAAHGTVVHSKEEWARGEISTNACENYFSLFKRGMRGVYQHCSEKHLHRYLAEFDFRYNNRIAKGVSDEQRATKMVKGIIGKRLTYRTPDQRAL